MELLGAGWECHMYGTSAKLQVRVNRQPGR